MDADLALEGVAARTAAVELGQQQGEARARQGGTHVRCVTLRDETGLVTAADLARAAEAFQVQVDRDLFPHWGVRAAVITDPVPGGSGWALRLVERSSLPAGASGIHLDGSGAPYALVAAGPDWTVAAGHELLEMLIDPHGNRFVAAPSPDPAAGGRAVYVLVEACDPCETSTYSINGIRVPDLVLPAFYQKGMPGPWDLIGQVSGPLQVLPGGFLSWFDPQDFAWHQALPDGSFASFPVDALDVAHPRGQRDRIAAPPAGVAPRPTFLPDNPRKDALDVAKPKEREAVFLPAPGQPAGPSTRQDTGRSAAQPTDGPPAAPGARGRSFIRPEERPEVGAVSIAADPPPPASDPSPPFTRRAGKAPTRRRARHGSGT